jgi:predicted transcriptional regulator
MNAEHPNRINVLLDTEHATKLHRIAERAFVQPGTIARSLLSQALDQVDPDAETIVGLLDAIPGAWERASEGLADAAAGRVVTLDKL